ncbi:hypothetical protein D3C80_2232100 [compost metagenome]
MREYSFLHAHDKDNRELQPLGTMHRHQNDRIRLLLRIIIHGINIRNEGKVRQE